MLYLVILNLATVARSFEGLSGLISVSSMATRQPAPYRDMGVWELSTGYCSRVQNISNQLTLVGVALKSTLYSWSHCSSKPWPKFFCLKVIAVLGVCLSPFHDVVLSVT